MCTENFVLFGIPFYAETANMRERRKNFRVEWNSPALVQSPTPDVPFHSPELPSAPDPEIAAPKKRRGAGGRILGGAVALLLFGALALGFWQHYSLHAQVTATAEGRKEYIPSVRTAPVRASASTMAVSWPATTEAFAQANIYARASGYISRRDVDIGSHVKAGQLLVEIPTAPELDHQIAQAEAEIDEDHATIHTNRRPVAKCEVIRAGRQSNVVDDEVSLVFRDDLADLVLNGLKDLLGFLDPRSGRRPHVQLNLAAVDDRKEVAADEYEKRAAQ